LGWEGAERSGARDSERRYVEGEWEGKCREGLRMERGRSRAGERRLRMSLKSTVRKLSDRIKRKNRSRQRKGLFNISSYGKNINCLAWESWSWVCRPPRSSVNELFIAWTARESQTPRQVFDLKGFLVVYLRDFEKKKEKQILGPRLRVSRSRGEVRKCQYGQ